MNALPVRRVALAVAALLAITVVLTHVLSSGRDYTVTLHDAAGIRSGDQVRIAGIAVGSVQGIRADGAHVDVRISLDQGAPITTGTRAEVKLSSLLGQRYLALKPEPGAALASGARLPLTNADDSYTIERFWLDSRPALTQLDLKTLSRAVDVLGSSLAAAPRSTRDALSGMATVAGIVAKRSDQIAHLLRAIRAVTDQVVAQRTQISGLLVDADQVMAMVASRRQQLDTLIRSAGSLADELATMARTNAAPMEHALGQLRTILTVLRQRRADLATTLRLAEPAMRLYVNSAGDGPWLGVNAPYFVLPDSFWCQARRDIGCRR